jgi:UDP-2-acetamido-2,6-beta-L-arabino-hexul-4-ose reductase
MRVRVEEITSHKDHRGVVFEPLGLDALPSQRNVHVVLTKPGGVRGNHHHRRGTESVIVYGPALVRFRDGEEIEERVVAEGCAVRFTIPAGVSHAFKNNGEEPNLLVCFNTEVHDQSNPDVVVDVLIES